MGGKVANSFRLLTGRGCGAPFGSTTPWPVLDADEALRALDAGVADVTEPEQPR